MAPEDPNAPPDGNSPVWSRKNNVRIPVPSVNTNLADILRLFGTFFGNWAVLAAVRGLSWTGEHSC